MFPVHHFRDGGGLFSSVWVCRSSFATFVARSVVSHAVAFLAAAILSIFPAPLFAQAPDEIAGQEMQRQQARERALREDLERRPDVRRPQEPSLEEVPLPENETPCFPIHRIEWTDEAPGFDWALAAAQFPGVSPDDPARGRCLGAQSINRLMARIQNAIIARGYITTRVLAQAQDLTTGTLRLTLLPGRIRAIRFTPESDPRATAWNAVSARPGDLLNLREVEQALENFKRLPTAEADIQIEPGDEPGESDLVIAWKQAFPLRLSLTANDGGAKSTGLYQGSLTVSGDHLLALNDLFYASLQRDLGGGDAGERGTRGYTLHYAVPWGYWTLGATASRNRYFQTVAGFSQNYRYSGQSRTQEIKLSRLVYRDAVYKTTLALRGYLTESQNFIDETEIEVQRRRTAGWEASLLHRAFIAAAIVDLTLAWRQGTGAFNALAAPEEAFGEGTARPRLITLEAALALPFEWSGQKLRYNGSLRAQWNRTPLIPQDRFSIGGRYTVRGFDGETVLSAERGWLLRNDLSLSLGVSGQELYFGLDHGRVGGPTAQLLVGTRLSGGVLGLRGAYKGLNYDLFLGRPLSRPEGFRTASTTAGFNLGYSF